MGVVAAQMGGRLGRALYDGALSELRRVSDAAGCLMPLLAALNWHGEPRSIVEAAPHCVDGLDIGGLRKILASLNYATRRQRVRLSEVDPRLLPCLFASDDGVLLVVLGVEGNGFQALEGKTGALTRAAGDLKGDAYFISEIAGEDMEQGRCWSSWVLARFKRFFLQIFVVTALTSVLALSVPLFIMTLYDQVIPAKSFGTLFFLGGGMAIVLVAEALLRLIRGRLIAYVGARSDLIVGTSALGQLLHIPVSMTERTPIGAQVARLQQFEVLREFFVGPMAGVVFELPFVLLAIFVMGLIGGPLAWIPVILTCVFAIVAAVAYPALRRANRIAGGAVSRRNEFLMETVANLRAVKEAGADDVWAQRHRELSATAAQAQHRVARTNAVLQSVSHLLMLLAGIAALGLGAQRVMQGNMSAGALIAAMALTWRVVSPLQSGLLSLSRFHQVLGGLRQVDRLMALPREKEPNQVYGSFRRFHGRLSFNRVSMRYTSDGNPALLGVSFTAEPGEVVAITGPNGCGKSTVVRLILGLYTPQGGAVSLDGIDIRQLDVNELRGAISYMPQATQVYHGTIAQNLRLTNPVATDDELREAADRANMLVEVEALPDGFDTLLTEAAHSRLSEGFLRKLCLAQTYLKHTSVYVFDEPSSNLDHADDAAFLRAVENLRGRASVFIVTHRPSHIRVADKVLVLRDGSPAFFGPPDELNIKGAPS